MKPGVDYIGIGCGSIIVNDKNEVLLVKRSKNSKTFAGMWSRPGGTIEFGEKVEDALKREIKEEVGLDIEIIRFLGYSDHIMVEGGVNKHWISLGFLTKIVGGEIKNLEPDRHDVVKWFPLDNLPENLTSYTKNGIELFLQTQ